jgi:hypothetical protein
MAHPARNSPELLPSTVSRLSCLGGFLVGILWEIGLVSRFGNLEIGGLDELLEASVAKNCVCSFLVLLGSNPSFSRDSGAVVKVHVERVFVLGVVEGGQHR